MKRRRLLSILTQAYYGRRFQFHQPWHLTRFGFVWPLIGSGGDEFHNRSVWVIVPMVGWFVIFTGPIVRDVEHFHGYGPDGPIGKFVSGCPDCLELVDDIDMTNEEFQKLLDKENE